MKLKSITAAVALVVAASPLWAHEIWLEPTEQGVKAFAGEFHLNAREGTPGMIEKLTQPSARVEMGNSTQPLNAQRQADGIAFDAKLESGHSVVFEEKGYPLFDDEHKGKKVKGAWLPAARWVSSHAAIKPSLPLDIVPTGQAGEFAVSLNGQPLPKAEIEIVAQSGWLRTLETNEQGKIKLSLPWQGQYVLVANHTDTKGGQLAGQKYRKAYLTTSLSFTQNEGMASPSALPISKPTH
jgi:hypothetical protein